MADAAPSTTAADTVAVVALVLAALALYAMVLQTASQGIAVITKKSRYCGKDAVGDWARSRRWKYHWQEYRFEMTIQVPVFFVDFPTASWREHPNTVVYQIDGTGDSREKTWTTSLRATKDGDILSLREGRYPWEPNAIAFGQAAIGQATWLAMLSSLQLMEEKASDWEQTRQGNEGPTTIQLRPISQTRTLTLCLQKKRLSWDIMPELFRRPLAFTTLEDLAIMAALQGIHWKVCDQIERRYLASGNGLQLEGSHVQGLGLVFTFNHAGTTRFGPNNILPVKEVKELCFGRVPILLEVSDGNKEGYDYKYATSLQLHSPKAAAETLRIIGCNPRTCEYILGEHGHTHCFPVLFEFMGMIARNIHLGGNFFRMLPNPTYATWNAAAAARIFPALHHAYANKLRDGNSERLSSAKDRSCLQSLSSEVLEALRPHARLKKVGPPEAEDPSWSLLQALHAALDTLDGILKENYGVVRRVIAAHIDIVMERLHESSPGLPHLGDETFTETPLREGSSLSEEERINLLMSTYFEKVFTVVDTRSRKDGDIWLVLVFRMLCWLTLHSFHPEDVQKGQDKLYASELPVYIN